MTCAQQIIAVLTDADRPVFLWEIADRILQRFGQRHSETAISARIRDEVRRVIPVMSEAPKGKRAHRYWVPLS